MKRSIGVRRGKFEKMLTVVKKSLRDFGRKALQPRDTIFEVVLIDVTEQPIERPKKATTAL